MKYSVFNDSNKIDKTMYDKIFNVLIENYAIREHLDLDTYKESIYPERYNSWVKTITTTPNYSIIIYYDNLDIIGFIATVVYEGKMGISEIQIDKKYQGKNNNLKEMMKIMYKDLSFDKYNEYYATINPHNFKSINVFTHVGFKNYERNKYVILKKDLLKWINL